MPTLVASYFVQQNTTAATAITTPSFTPSNGEVIIVKLVTWDTGTAMGAPTGGSQTYTSRIIVAPGGFRPWCGIYTAVISGSPGSMTISSTPAASARYSMVVERWSSAQLAATPVTNASGTTNGGTGSAASTLTTSAANSVISWCAGDAQSLDPSTRAYLGSATDEGVRDGHVGANGVDYHAYQTVTSAGSTNFGLSAPTGMQWCIAGIEVLDAGGSTTISVGDMGSAADSLAAAATAPLADAGSAGQTLAVAATTPLSDGGSAADALAAAAAVALADAGSAVDSLTVAVTVALADAASAADGVDNGLGTSKALADGGSAADSLGVVAAISFADAGAATQALGAQAAVALADSAASAEALTTPARTIQLADTGSAAEALAVAAGIMLADTGAAADGATGADGSNVAKALADSGSARDWLHAKAVRSNTGTTSRPNTGITPRPDSGITYRP